MTRIRSRPLSVSATGPDRGREDALEERVTLWEPEAPAAGGR